MIWQGTTSQYVNGEGDLVTFPAIPSVGNGTLTVQGTGALGGTGTFTANQSGNTTISVTHDSFSDTATTDTATLSFGGTFDAYTDVTTNSTGHVTGHEVTTFTLPANPNVNTTSLPVKNSGGTTQFTSTQTTGVRFAGSGATSVAFTPGTQLVTISSTNSNETYTLPVAAGGANSAVLNLTAGGTGSGIKSSVTINGDSNTVKVTEKFVIERYSHVMHIVSNVIGKFNKKFSKFDTLLSGFPAGTVSGAPKIRAMEIIDELENTKRKVYAGGIGYFSANGDFDTCIALRTAVSKNNKFYVQAGAGIVADSKPMNEYKETVNKAKALLKSLE